MNRLAMLSMLALMGCDTTLTGSDGNFELSYTHGGLFESVSSPIGEGLMIDVVIRDIGTSDAISIDQADTDNPDVLQVVNIGTEGTMDLQAGIAGDADLNVTSTIGVTDSFPLTVQPIGEVRYGEPTFNDNDTGGYVIAAGASIWIPRDITSPDGESLTGYGLPAPTITPAEGGTGLEDGAVGATRVLFNAPGEVSLSYEGGFESTYTVIDATNVSWDVDDFDSEEGVSSDAPSFFQVTGIDSEGRQVLGSLDSLDESICAVYAWLGSADIYWVEARSTGDCSLILNNDTTNVVASFPIVVE